MNSDKDERRFMWGDPSKAAEFREHERIRKKKTALREAYERAKGREAIERLFEEPLNEK